MVELARGNPDPYGTHSDAALGAQLSEERIRNLVDGLWESAKTTPPPAAMHPNTAAAVKKFMKEHQQHQPNAEEPNAEVSVTVAVREFPPAGESDR